MASKRVAQSTVKWSEFADLVPQSYKSTYNAFKAKSDGYLRKTLANPDSTPKIDWSYYKANIAAPGIADAFEKQFSALQVPYPKDQGAYAEIDNLEKLCMTAIEKFIKDSNGRIDGYNKDLVAIKNAIPYENMTCEDWAYAHPELALLPLIKPTNFPHQEEDQFTPEQLEYLRVRGMISGPDKYHP